MVPEYKTIKYFYGTECYYEFDRGEGFNPNRYKDAKFEFLHPVCGQKIAFGEWDEVCDFINEITPKYISFLNQLLEPNYELILKN